MKFQNIISVSGRISSGKSFASKLIEEETGFPVASFGRYLVFYCKEYGLPIDRTTLQNVGEKFIQTDPNQFLIDVINHFIHQANSIIIDGVRHKVIFEEIKKIATNDLGIFIDADQQLRFERYSQRIKDTDEQKSFTQFLEADTHPVELETESLKPLCNIVLSSKEDYSSELNEFLLQNL